ncbi:glycosyltransferase family 2 protein [Frankia sp. Cr2]|uniref:glycosyltransferase family 2 protein n=1 Tax=Frankia sp. Cr2 TaxID=3073932 RepID=UPI002AD43317|nr:glycosyltransferase family 2 protein [Frankia sp. Cr2]
MAADVILITAQTLLLVYFSFFGWYNYLYLFAGLRKQKLTRIAISHENRVAVVIASFNEKGVIADTIAACLKMTYHNKTIIVADDSNDPETISILQDIAGKNGCMEPLDPRFADPNVTVLESPSFVLFHRIKNVGYKAGNLSSLERYLTSRGYGYMYLLDADWHPQEDAVERCLEVIDAAPDIAFVQTKRLYYYGKGDHFQRCLALSEEGCYLVDLPGRQQLGETILFSGCCALFKLSHLSAVGGFQPGHLTEDLDLTNRFYLAGYRGVYLGDVANVGEVAPSYRAFRKQQERWTIGTARTLREYFWPIIRSRLISRRVKLSLLRQNGYFTVAVAMEMALVLFSVGAVLHTLNPQAGSKILGAVVTATTPVSVLAFASGFFPLAVVAIKRRAWLSLLYIPMTCWIVLSVIHTYFIGNIKGFRGGNHSWFLTPKTTRTGNAVKLASTPGVTILNFATLFPVTLSFAATYPTNNPLLFAVWSLYALLWIPSLTLACWAS